MRFPIQSEVRIKNDKFIAFRRFVPGLLYTFRPFREICMLTT